MQAFSPREIVSELDRYIIGQDDAKKSVAIALRNRWRRQQLPEDNFRILGQNQRTLEFILQVKEFSPSKLRDYLRNLPKLFTGIEKVRLYPWSPNP